MSVMDWINRNFDVISPHSATPPPPVAPALSPSPVPGCDDDTWAAFEKLMEQREGAKYVVYYDTLGKPTGGIGHLILPSDGLKIGNNIPDATVRRWFTHDGATAMDGAVTQAKQAGIKSQPFLPFLASVCYQLGPNWIMKFPNTWQLICKGQYRTAASALNNTTWDKQTPVRVADMQSALLALPVKPA